MFSVQEERETARVHRVVEWRLFLFLFLLYTVLINSSAIQSTKLGNTASVEGSGGGVMGMGEALQTVCSSLDAKGSFFAKTCGVIRISCCSFIFKKSREKSHSLVKLSMCLFCSAQQ